MGVNSLPKTVTRQRRDCDSNPGPSAPESSTLTTRLPSHPYPVAKAYACTSSSSNSSSSSSAKVVKRALGFSVMVRAGWRNGGSVLSADRPVAPVVPIREYGLITLRHTRCDVRYHFR